MLRRAVAWRGWHRTAHQPRAGGRGAGDPVLAAPVHPGLARIMRLMSLPDDAFSERFEGAMELERDFGLTLTSVREFVRQQVRLARPEPTG